MKKTAQIKKIRRDSVTESKTYITIMDGLPNYERLYFKVGKTINTDERFRQIKTSNPFIKTILLFNFDCEYYLHKSLKKYHLTKEWFTIDCTDVRTLANIITPHIIKYNEILNEHYERQYSTESGK